MGKPQGSQQQEYSSLISSNSFFRGNDLYIVLTERDGRPNNHLVCQGGDCYSHLRHEDPSETQIGLRNLPKEYC